MVLGAILARHVVRLERALGRRGENLIARRPGATPRVWLAAHYDTKGQRLSMAGRLVAVGAVVLGTAGFLKLSIAAAFGFTVAATWWWAAAALVAAGGIAMAAAGLRNESPGALDNGSGVLAVLAAAEQLRDVPAVGVLLLDAEEFGLVGARALAREGVAWLRETAVINLDGLDDSGPMIAFVHRPGPLTDALCVELGARRWARLPVFVDGIALAPACREAVTIMRGGWATTRIVHTPRDTADRLTYAGVETVAAGIVRALKGAAFSRGLSGA